MPSFPSFAPSFVGTSLSSGIVCLLQHGVSSPKGSARLRLCPQIPNIQRMGSERGPTASDVEVFFGDVRHFALAPSSPFRGRRQSCSSGYSSRVNGAVYTIESCATTGSDKRSHGRPRPIVRHCSQRACRSPCFLREVSMSEEQAQLAAVSQSDSNKSAAVLRCPTMC